MTLSSAVSDGPLKAAKKKKTTTTTKNRVGEGSQTIWTDKRKSDQVEENIQLPVLMTLNILCDKIVSFMWFTKNLQKILTERRA